MKRRFRLTVTLNGRESPIEITNLTIQELRSWIEGFLRDEKYQTFSIERIEDADG